MKICAIKFSANVFLTQSPLYRVIHKSVKHVRKLADATIE